MTNEEYMLEADKLLAGIIIDPIPALSVWPGDTLILGLGFKIVVSVTKVNNVTRNKDVRIKISDGLHEQDVDFDVTQIVYKVVYKFA